MHRTLTLLALVAATPAMAQAPKAVALAPDACAPLANLKIPPTAFGIASGAGSIDSAVIVEESKRTIADRAPTPAARISPATPRHCKLLGRIAPIDPAAPPIRFQINLPLAWNGSSLQYGGGGFNGVLITGLANPPAHPFDRRSPLAQGYVTYGTDSGHETKQGEPVQAFAANDEAFVNFAHAAYKKVKDAAVAVMTAAYKRPPRNTFFMGSSEGGREGLTMAQRYPDDFDGILSRVPVINWTGLMHASMRGGLVTMGDAYLKTEHVKLVQDAVLGACDGGDGSKDGLVANPSACLKTFDVAKLKCAVGANPATCLNDGQIKAVQTLRSPVTFSFPLANGVRSYPGWGISGEAATPNGPTGGWNAWWVGMAPPAQPALPNNGISWVYGSGAIRHIYARDLTQDVTTYKPEDHKKRILEVSALMDSTNPNLSRFRARGGKLIVLEYMADYAQSPYAGIRYFESVESRMGKATVASFARLYTAPGVDHVGNGAPGNVDMLAVLNDWVENGKAPGTLEVVEQTVEPEPKTVRALPLCQWPLWPRYIAGDVKAAASYACVKSGT